MLSERVRWISRCVFPLSPRLCQDVTVKTSRFAPSIILAQVRKVNNPSVATSLTHVESEPETSFILLRLWPRNNRRAARTARLPNTEVDQRSDAQPPLTGGVVIHTAVQLALLTSFCFR